MVRPIEQIFPGLRGTAYQVTSPPDEAYNCIAWAAGDNQQWWWPDEAGQPDSAHWPPGVLRVETLDAFRQAFATLGYVVCNDDLVEGGFEPAPAAGRPHWRLRRRGVRARGVGWGWAGGWSDLMVFGHTRRHG